MSGEKLNFAFFKELFDTAKRVTQETITSSSIISRTSNLRELAADKELEDVKIGLSFEDEGDEVPEVVETKAKSADRVTLVLNKLGKIVMELISKMGLHEKVIKFNKEASKANKKEIDVLKEKSK